MKVKLNLNLVIICYYFFEKRRIIIYLFILHVFYFIWRFVINQIKNYEFGPNKKKKKKINIKK